MKVARIGLWIAAAASLGVLASCGGSAGTSSESSAGSSPAAVKISPAARQEAQQIFATRCAACHGPQGRGDGPGAAGLKPPPRNYHDPAWQATVKDDEIEKAIVYGGAAVGKSPGMIGNPDLGSKPEVVAALREIVREFGKTQ